MDYQNAVGDRPSFRRIREEFCFFDKTIKDRSDLLQALTSLGIGINPQAERPDPDKIDKKKGEEQQTKADQQQKAASQPKPKETAPLNRERAAPSREGGASSHSSKTADTQEPHKDTYNTPSQLPSQTPDSSASGTNRSGGALGWNVPAAPQSQSGNPPQTALGSGQTANAAQNLHEQHVSAPLMTPAAPPSNFAGGPRNASVAGTLLPQLQQALAQSQQGKAAHPFNPKVPLPELSENTFGHPPRTTSLSAMIKSFHSLTQAHPSFINRAVQAAAVLHGSLLFVKDGNQMRSFRLRRDGTFVETHARHRGLPLSAAARAEIRKLSYQHERLKGQIENLLKKFENFKGHGKELLAGDHLKLLLQENSSFTDLLRRVIENGKEIGHYLNEGENPQFFTKEDWAAFFTRMIGLGSAEKSSSKAFSKILEFMFRGLFKKQGESSDTLVSDFKYEMEGKLKEEKFAQIGITNEELVNLLKKLRPGETISKETLQQFMGEELNFTQLIHVIQKTDPMLASELLKNVQFDPAASIDPYSQARLEHHIFSKSRRRGLPGSADLPDPTGSLLTGEGSVIANAYELQQKQRREFLGKAKLYTLITYTSIALGILLFLYFLFKFL